MLHVIEFFEGKIKFHPGGKKSTKHQSMVDVKKVNYMLCSWLYHAPALCVGYIALSLCV